MSEESTGYFHCARCGRIFQAGTGVAMIRRCSHCGGDPAAPIADRQARRLPEVAGDVVRGMVANPAATAQPASSPPSDGVRRHAGSRRRTNPVLRRLVIFIGAWVLLLGVFAVVMKVVNDRRERGEAERMDQYKRGLSDLPEGLELSDRVRDREFIEDAYPGCRQAIYQVLNSASPEVRLQWVCEPMRIAGLMGKFYQSNTAYLPGEMPEHEFIGVIESGDGPVIESLWTTTDGRRIEANFRNDDGEWRLDWEAFVRFSETPWVMFLAGGGKDVQDFRLLVRERLAEERRLEPTLSLVMHPPRFGTPEEAGPASPEFLVPRLSVAGRKLGSLLKMRREGAAPLGARIPSQDPDDMIRVRVRVRRVEEEDKRRRFEILEVLAGHWLGIQDDGMPAEGE